MNSKGSSSRKKKRDASPAAPKTLTRRSGRVGFIGMGRMGGNMALSLLEKGWRLVVFDRDEKSKAGIVKAGAAGASSVPGLAAALKKPRVVWIMVPAGKPVDSVIAELLPVLEPGDLVIDGGNSFFQDSQRRERLLKRRGVHFLDVGTSGGVDGARRGACMMIGGEKRAFEQVELLFRDLCVKDGYGFVGGPGAGHFIKMVHNGIEYGMMAAIAEGLEVVKQVSGTFHIDLGEVAKVYAHGSIIESKLMTWTFESIKEEGFLEGIAGSVPKGETEDEMAFLEKMGGLTVLAAARKLRVASRKKPSFAGKLMAAMRNKFGGHAVKKKR
ncbi:decarboxylating 6-phosphogluconate dehydrogenase [Candidatus Woesearchaeota archaeon]|nr:MAG: decarboxylating 6-phosphogluconate dehydrogenase [Candidatus Woesearchaeota archaeon]